MKLLIRGGRIVDPAQDMDRVGDVLVDHGKIAAVGDVIEPAGDMQVIDAKGMVVTPGLIDMHVHLREPGQEHKETIETGTRAAAAGGFTAVCAMPNTEPVMDNYSVVHYVREKGRQAGYARVYPVGAITKGLQGKELTELADLISAGVVAVSDDGRPVSNAAVMRRALEYAKPFKLPIVSHAEDRDLSGDGVMHEGTVSTKLGLNGIPAAAENVAVARDILLAEATGGKLHLAHISTARAVELVRQAKQRGVPVTAEATPHHFTLTHEAVVGYDTSTKVNPPLRSQEDVEAVIAGLKDGTIDAIATDHAPHAEEEKDVEYDLAPFGLIGLETALPLVVTKLIEPGILSWKQAVSLMSTNPARILNLPGGTLKVGSPADITVINPELRQVVSRDKLVSKAKNTPFAGWSLQGWTEYTIVGGSIVYRRQRKED
ncbi:MAG: dihydroorotase [Thermoanaerobacteraceae bacterium]|nr:dihydroorotase [Thermoanaerobacteraceae bacterium]